VDSIRVEELILLDHPTLIDVRAFYYYDLGHIPGAISVPYYHLLNNYSHYLTRHHRYYLYCDTGEQSSEIVSRLNRFGYDTVNIIGGYQEFLRVFG